MGWRYGFIVSTCGTGACTLRYLFNLVLDEKIRLLFLVTWWSIEFPLRVFMSFFLFYERICVCLGLETENLGLDAFK